MKAVRLTDGVDVYLERESVIQSDTQTLNTVRRQRSHIAQVNRSDVRFYNLPGARAYYNGFSFIRIEGKSVQIEPVVQSAEAVSQHLSGVGVSECQVQRGVVCILHVIDAEKHSLVMTCHPVSVFVMLYFVVVLPFW